MESDNARLQYTVRSATIDDAPVLARHRSAMFRDMGRLRGPGQELEQATVMYLSEAMPRGEYLAWVAEVRSQVVGGAGVQLRRILPRVRDDAEGLELGPEAIVLNVYVEREWRRRGVAEALMRVLLDALDARAVRRIVLHASEDGRALYERLGFIRTNEMRLARP